VCQVIPFGFSFVSNGVRSLSSHTSLSVSSASQPETCALSQTDGIAPSSKPNQPSSSCACDSLLASAQVRLLCPVIPQALHLGVPLSLATEILRDSSVFRWLQDTPLEMAACSPSTRQTLQFMRRTPREPKPTLCSELSLLPLTLRPLSASLILARCSGLITRRDRLAPALSSLARTVPGSACSASSSALIAA